jgi:hypothetical protein
MQPAGSVQLSKRYESGTVYAGPQAYEVVDVLGETTGAALPLSQAPSDFLTLEDADFVAIRDVRLCSRLGVTLLSTVFANLALMSGRDWQGEPGSRPTCGPRGSQRWRLGLFYFIMAFLTCRRPWRAAQWHPRRRYLQVPARRRCRRCRGLDCRH